MYDPLMSLGSRSGVNCTRAKSIESVRAMVRTSVVLATPGTPSSRMCPFEKSAARQNEMASRWP